MRHRRGESGLGGLIAIAIFGGLCWLLWVGGRTVWSENFGAKADPGCYWLMRDDEEVCLMDAPVVGECFPRNRAVLHVVTCGKTESPLVDFTQKAGRKLCSPILVLCPDVVPIPKGAAVEIEKRIVR